jgi:DNA (cytosine-5)-methyltransferase 1
MLKTLTDEGYVVEWRVVNSAEYGFPQRRIRVFIIAKRTSEVSDWSKLDPEDYIASSGVLARALPAQPKDSLRTISLKPSAVEISENFNLGGGKSPFASAGFARKGIAYSLNVAAAYKGSRSTLADIISDEDEVDASFWVEEKALAQWKYLKGAKKIKRIHKGSGEEYNYAEGSMAFPDLLTNPSRTILTGEGGSTPSRFKHIIQVGKRHRRLTPLELERLNGFPDNWTATFEDGKPVNDARRAFFMGNALVIGLIEKVGKEIARRISE